MASRRSWVRIPSAPPTYLISSDSRILQGAPRGIELLSKPTRCGRPYVCLAFAWIYRFAVDLHYDADISAAHEFLLHFHRNVGSRVGPRSSIAQGSTLAKPMLRGSAPDQWRSSK